MRISDWSSDVCSSDLSVQRAVGRRVVGGPVVLAVGVVQVHAREDVVVAGELAVEGVEVQVQQVGAEARRRAVQVRGAVEVGIGEAGQVLLRDRKSTRLNYSH